METPKQSPGEETTDVRGSIANPAVQVCADLEAMSRTYQDGPFIPKLPRQREPSPDS